MPFEQYLRQPDIVPTTRFVAEYDVYDDGSRTQLSAVQPAYPGSVQLQIPQYMYSAVPPLAPGGGAEVLPAGLFNDSRSLTSSWFVSSGLQPFSSTSPSKQYASTTNVPLPGHFDAQVIPTPSLFGHHSTLSDASEISDRIHTSYVQPFVSDPQHSDNVRSTSSQSSLDVKNFLPLGPSDAFPVPTSLDLPVYSASGFDLLSILARVVARPHPSILLGPVDASCAFVVADVRRFDSPIVYASPTFCRLTGYEEYEVLGRNCRFLQAPDGNVQKGEERHYVAQAAVAHLKKSLFADKECQTSIVNYRKGGQPFVNLLTVIPIAGGVTNHPDEADEVVYHVGFQVDVTQQPNTIVQRLRDGSYVVDYSARIPIPPPLSAFSRDRKLYSHPSAISQSLQALLSDPRFIDSIPISTSPPSHTALANAATLPTIPTADNKSDSVDGSLLNLILLENLPDFIHVLSLKGSFLYVAPSVRLVLGYEPDEMVGKSIADYCHPQDLVPLMRELKESSATPGAAAVIDAHESSPSSVTTAPRLVDLLFRVQSKHAGYVWLECRGRLHAEPGKGRKAIILSGRAKRMPTLSWGTIALAGGLTPLPPCAIGPTSGDCDWDRDMYPDRDSHTRSSSAQTNRGLVRGPECEFWGMLGSKGSFLFVGAAVLDVLGWTPEALLGRKLDSFVAGGASARGFAETLVAEARARAEGEVPCVVACEMRTKGGRSVSVHISSYPSSAACDGPAQFLLPDFGHSSSRISPSPSLASPTSPTYIPSYPTASSSIPCAIVINIRLANQSSPFHAVDGQPFFVHSPSADVFAELATGAGSSWQYELQQLRYANQRLAEEVSALEAEVGAVVGPTAATGMSGTQRDGAVLSEGGLVSKAPMMADTKNSALLSQTSHSRGEQTQQHNGHECAPRRSSTAGSHRQLYIQTGQHHLQQQAHQHSQQQHSQQQLYQQTQIYQCQDMHSPTQPQSATHGDWDVGPIIQSRMPMHQPSHFLNQTHIFTGLKRTWGSENGPT